MKKTGFLTTIFAMIIHRSARALIPCHCEERDSSPVIASVAKQSRVWEDCHAQGQALDLAMTEGKSGARNDNNGLAPRRTLVFTICYLLFAVCSLHAAGETAAEFLKLSPSARATALGDAGSTSLDVSAAYYNPGALAGIIQGEASFMHVAHYQDISYSYAAAAYPTKSGTFAASIGSLGVGKFQGYNALGEPTREVTAGASVIGISYANFLVGDTRALSKLAGGLSVKQVSEMLDKKTAATIAFDMGLIYSVLVADRPLALGLSALNTGGSIKYNPESEGFATPMTIRAGALYSVSAAQNPLNIMLEAAVPQSDTAAVGLGLEYIIRGILAVRGGYSTGASSIKEAVGIRFGFGINLMGVEFDYASAHAGELGISHRAGVTVRFGRQSLPIAIGLPPTISSGSTVESLYQRAVKLYEDGRYPEAVIEFNRVLEADPTNQKALEYMKKATEKIK
ncbi:MAG: PorV/PorQ family protein [Endomicrobiia bacterium]|nr:PorV/PorQ family protein [Endomicrobiia bacterium]